jgi:hypothetical protein
MTANTLVDSDHDCDNDNINGKESKSATSVKVAKVVGLMQGIVQNPGDKKSRQNEEEVNTQPADGSEVRKRVLIAKRVDMAEENHEESEPAEAVKALQVLPMVQHRQSAPSANFVQYGQE